MYACMYTCMYMYICATLSVVQSTHKTASVLPMSTP